MKKYLPIIILIINVLSGCRTADFFAPPQTLELKDYKKDWSIFSRALTEFHPALTAYHSEKVINDHLVSQERKIDQITDYNQFFAILSETIDFIGDGHTAVSHPEWYWETKSTGWFPLELFPVKDQLYILYENDLIPQGSRITYIDGIEAAQVLNELKIYTTGDGYPKPFETELLAFGFSEFYTNHFGSKEKYSISWIGPDEKKEKNILAKSWLPTDMDVSDEEYAEEAPMAYEFSIISSERAYLAVDSFEFSEEEGYSVNTEDYIEFLEKTFTELKDKGTKELILDLRRNGGGDPLLLAELLSYLIDKEFILDKKTFAKTDTIPLKEYILPSQKKMAKEIERELRELTEKDDRGLYVYKIESEEDSIEVVPKRELYFQGDLKVLVSYSTFSAAAMCAAILEDRTDALTIGQETSGGYARLCAASDFDYRLPSTGIQVSIPTVGILTNIINEKFPHGRGTIPDIIVEDRIGPILKGLDPEMEAALAN